MPSPPSTPRVRAAAAREVQEAKQEAEQLAAAQAEPAPGTTESQNPDESSTIFDKLKIEFKTAMEIGFEQMFKTGTGTCRFTFC